MLRLAVISYHTSPLALLGTGDGGGMNVYVRALSGALARAGVTCDVFTRASSGSEPPVVVAEPGVRVFAIDAGPRHVVGRDLLPSYVPVFAGRVVETADECRRTYDMIHSHYWLSGQVATYLSREWEVPFVHTFHTLGRVRNLRLAPQERPEPQARIAAEDRIVRAATRLLASTPAEARELTEHYGAAERCVEVIPPGVDHRLFRPSGVSPRRARLRLGLGRRRTILAVGRIQPLKGFDVAIEAFAHLRADDVQLVLIGGPSGPAGADEQRRLRAQAARLGVARRVRFLDPVPHEHLPDWYRAADVVVVPSRSESFGFVALEAQACGVPVVVSDVGGLQDVVEDGTGGIRVPPGDAKSMGAALAAVLGDEGLRDRLRDGAEAWSHRFGWSATAAHLRSLFLELTEPRARAGCGEATSVSA